MAEEIKSEASLTMVQKRLLFNQLTKDAKELKELAKGRIVDDADILRGIIMKAIEISHTVMKYFYSNSENKTNQLANLEKIKPEVLKETNIASLQVICKDSLKMVKRVFKGVN